MPHVIIKKVWDYCSYSKSFFALILILMLISSVFQNYVRIHYMGSIIWDLVQIIVFITVAGYGMLITRSRINHGQRLPKIEIKDILSLGIKSSIVTGCYYSVQTWILFMASPGNFPVFDLEELLLDPSETFYLLYYHNPVETILFVVLGFLLFYITTFFYEIALARLADTNSIFEAFNLPAIKRNIDVFGWRNYTRECTLIILTIVILTYVISFESNYFFLDAIIDMVLGFLIFATQYLGIGAVYAKIKDLESENSV